MRTMSRLFPLGLFFVWIGTVESAPAEGTPSAVVTPVLSATTTPSGQPIRFPSGDGRVIVSTYVIAPGSSLPVHKHPYPRYAYVLEGHLRVTDTDTGQSWDYQAGDFVVEVVDQWHFGEAIGTGPVRLLVIDCVPKAEAGNTVKK